MSELTPSAEASPGRDLAAEEAMHKAFDLWLPRHVNRYLSPLPYDPELYPEQRIDAVTVEPQNPTLEKSHLYGRAAIGPAAFYKLVSDFKNPPHNLAAVVKGRLCAHKNSLVVTGHAQNVLDTALGHNALFCAMEDEKLAPRNGIIINKLMTRLQINKLPVPRVLANSGRVYLGIPATKSAEEAGLSHDTIARTNRSMLRELMYGLRQGAAVHWALPSSVAKPAGEAMVIPRVSEESARLVDKYLNYALALVMWLSEEPDKSRSAIIPPYETSIRHTDDVHIMMEKLAGKLTELSEGSVFSYDSPPDINRRRIARPMGRIAANLTEQS